MSFILDNKNNLNYGYYLYSEWDCYCEANLDILFNKYKKNDVTVPMCISFVKENPDVLHFPDWTSFKGITDKIDHKFLRGFAPITFILFSKKSILAIAEKYKELWPLLKEIKNEARLGTVCKMLDLNIGTIKEQNWHYKYKYNPNVDWETKIHFKRKSNIYHPIKNIIDDNAFIKDPNIPTNNFGLWKLYSKDRLNYKKICNIYLQKDGFINSDIDNDELFYWGEHGQDIYFYNNQGNITSIFSEHENNNIYIGCKYDGEYESKLQIARFYKLEKLDKNDD